MDAHALDFERLVVQVKAGRSIEAQRAKSSWGDRFVKNAVAVFEDGFHRIHGRRVHRPKPWIFDRQSELGRRLAEGNDFAGLGYRANGLALGVKERDLHLRPGIFPTRIGESDLGRNRPFPIRRPHRLRKDAVGDEVNRRALDQPSVPVNSRALIPPAFLGLGIDAHSHGVELIAVFEQRSDIGRERSVAAPVAVHDRAIHPHGAVRGDAIELSSKCFPRSEGSIWKCRRYQPKPRLRNPCARFASLSIGDSDAQSCGRSTSRQAVSSKACAAAPEAAPAFAF